jgi:hypothetical protein
MIGVYISQAMPTQYKCKQKECKNANNHFAYINIIYHIYLALATLGLTHVLVKLSQVMVQLILRERMSFSSFRPILNSFKRGKCYHDHT